MLAYFQHENELTAYRSEVTELHLKLQAQNGPFNLTSKFNSEELKQSLQSKIEKLESMLEAETKKLEHCVSVCLKSRSLYNLVHRAGQSKPFKTRLRGWCWTKWPLKATTAASLSP